MHRQFSARNEDAGFTLIEVVVAMLVFAIIATGFLMTLTASMVTTRDTRARIVAANLASQQIDLVRSRDVFDVTSSTRDITLNGDTFHVAVHASWATSTGSTATCESAGATGALSYRQVTVEVTWDNMRAGTPPVYADTSIAPDSKINDPSLGTILVGVIDAAGAGVSGATVSLSPANGIASVTTDSDGCAYLLKVPPAASYTVSITKTGYVSDQQVLSPSAAVSVVAGSTSRASFGYDKATTFTSTYAGGTPKLPTDLTTSYISTYDSFKLAAATDANPKSVSLFPVSSGYSVVAGAYTETPGNPTTSCLAPDPGQWIPDGTLVGTRPDPVAGLPGTTVAAAIATGVVQLANPNGSGRYVTAVYVGGGAGDPGCGVGMTYKYGTVLTSSSGTGSATLALPFGTWQLYRGSSAGATTTLITSGLTVTSTGSVTAGTVLLDPRVAG